jgi:predicted Fe-S protein YdhL (DUF1289 family)
MAKLSLAMISTTADKTTSDDNEPQPVSPDSTCVPVCSKMYDDICRGCGGSVIQVYNWAFITQEERDAVCECTNRRLTSLVLVKSPAIGLKVTAKKPTNQPPWCSAETSSAARSTSRSSWHVHTARASPTHPPSRRP